MGRSARRLGVLMVAAGVVLALGLDTRLTTALVQDVPAYTDTLQALERTSAVERELAGPAHPRRDRHPAVPRRGARVGPGRGPTSACRTPGPAPELRGISATFNTGDAPL